MAGSTRITGAKLWLRLGTTDQAADIVSYTLTNEEADSNTVTFGDAMEGGKRQWKLNGSAIQSTDSTSFWSWVWANTGVTVAFTIAPHGNSSPTSAQPHFTGNVKIGRKPDLGGEAGASNEFTFDFDDWNVVGTPTRLPAA